MTPDCSRSRAFAALPQSLRRALSVAVLSAAVASAAAQPVAIGGDWVRGRALAEQVCAGCHGADGNSTDPYFPKLAGQGEFYLFEQLQVFQRMGSMRTSGVMSAMALDLDRQQMGDLAAWFSRQPPKLPAIAPTQVGDRVAESGEQIYLQGIPDKNIPACASCHAVSGAGLPPEYPRLAGQHPQYLERQLLAFRSGARWNNPNRLMRMVAHDMSDREIVAVSRYIGLMR